jgi:hypothetical protein
VGGQGACPPEDCGGPEGYQARREEAFSVEAFDDLGTMARLLKAIVLDGRHELLDNEDTRWELEDAVERARERQPFLAEGFSRREVNARFREDEHRRLMHQGY